MGEFRRFLSKDSAKLEWNFAKAWVTDFKSYFQRLLSSFVFVWTETFLDKPSNLNVFQRSSGLALLFF